MKLGLFHPSFRNVGGAEILVASHAQFLREAGHDVEIVTFDFHREIWAQRIGDIPVRLIRKRHWSEAFHFGDPVRAIESGARRAADALQGFDAVISYNHPCSAMLGLADVDARKIWHCNEPPRKLYPREASPYLASLIGDRARRIDVKAARKLKTSIAEQERSGRTRRARDHDLESVNRLDAIWALSEFTRDNLCRVYGARKVDVIYPLVRFSARDSSGKTSAKEAGAPLEILTQSRLGTVKNVETVVRGLDSYLRRSKSGAHLHVVGEGRDAARLATIARTLGLERNVTFHGFLSDAALDSVYARCDVFALLPFDEPFGMVFPEAAARGLLLVGPDHGGPVEILENGALGWMVPALSPDAVCAAFEEIRALAPEDAERRRALADRACRARFGREAIGRRLLELLSAEVQRTTSKV